MSIETVSPSTSTPSPPVVRPWVRFWARLVDMAFFALLVAIMFPSWNPTITLAEGSSLMMSFLSWTLISLVVYILFESALLCFVGKTLGKWLLKVSVKDNEDHLLTFSVALKRTFLVYFKGLAFMVPPITIITQIIAYKALTSRGTTSWDSDCHTTVIHQKIGMGRIIAAIVILLAITKTNDRFTQKYMENLGLHSSELSQISPHGFGSAES